MDVSVIICTYNRASSLRQTLSTFKSLRVPTNVQWELLVIDNNSNDNTAEVSCAFEAELPLRYFFEPRPGKSNALNQSIVEARGRLLLFTDDDVDVDPEWLINLWQASTRHVRAAFFSGKIIPRWEKSPPPWLERYSATLLSGVTVSFDLGEEERIIPADGCLGKGANLLFRAATFKQSQLSFRTDLGPTGKDPVRYEETALLEKLVESGHCGIYVPNAIVYHRNGTKRMTEGYVREYFKGEGMADVRLGRVEAATKNWLFGVPRWWWRKLSESAFAYFWARFITRSDMWVQHECIMAKRWGRICELRSMQKLGVRYKTLTQTIESF